MLIASSIRGRAVMRCRSLNRRACAATCILLVIIFLSGCDVSSQPHGAAPSSPTSTAYAQQQEFDAAVAAYQARDYATARARFTVLANSGNAPAKSNLAVMALHGQGTAPDAYRAYQLFAEAAQQGVAHAAMNAGFLQVAGNGTEADPEAGAARIRAARTMPELQEEIHTRIELVCIGTRDELRRLPTIFDLFKKHMPGKAALCAFDTLAADTADDDKFGKCVRTTCRLEVALGEADSCESLYVESAQNERRRAMLRRVLVAMECST